MSRRRDKSVNELEGPVTDVPVELPQRHLFVKCPGCKRVIDQDDLRVHLDVCPRCGHHLRVSGRRRMEMTCDAASFEEWDRELAATDFLGFPGYAQKLDQARQMTGEDDAVVCGRGLVGGRPCALFFMDADFMMGSMGSVVGEKICRVFERARELGLPVVGFTVSGGARMQEGATSLMQMAKVSAAVRRHREAGLAYLVVLTDPTTGGVTASFAMEANVTLAEPGALVAFAGPRVIEQTTHKRLPSGFQRSEFLLEHGFCDLIVERQGLTATLAELLCLHAGVVPGADAPHALGREEPSRRRERRGDGRVAGSDAYDIVKMTRSTDRPTALELVERSLDGFVELHGDRLFGDDAVVVAGIGWRAGRVLTVVALERGRSTKGAGASKLWHGPPGGLPQGAAPHARGGALRPARRLPRGHLGSLLRRRDRAARPGRGHRRQPRGPVGAARARGERDRGRGGQRRCARARRGRPGAHARERGVLRREPRGLCHDPVEEGGPRPRGGPCPAPHGPRPQGAWARGRGRPRRGALRARDRP